MYNPAVPLRQSVTLRGASSHSQWRGVMLPLRRAPRSGVEARGPKVGTMHDLEDTPHCASRLAVIPGIPGSDVKGVVSIGRSRPRGPLS
jgi:hypothetical protein